MGLQGPVNRSSLNVSSIIKSVERLMVVIVQLFEGGKYNILIAASFMHY